jgi:hypothetical protein
MFLKNNLNPIDMEFIKDIWNFLKERKKYWLIPMIIVLLIVGILIIFGGSSSVAPFVYTLF